jgi:phosphonate transport system substrate-binding protein
VSDIELVTGPLHLDEDGEQLRAELGRELGNALGAVVHVRAEESYGELTREVTDGRADLAWLPPAPFVRAQQARAIARVLQVERGRGASYRAALFVAEGSARRTPEELRGAKVAWVDRDSAAGFLFPRLALRKRGLDPRGLFASESLMGSHARVVRAVRDGEADVGATHVQLASEDAPTGPLGLVGWVPYLPHGAMRAVLVTAPIPADAVVVTTRVPEAYVDAVAQVLARAHETPKLAAALQAMMGASKLVRCEPSHYDAVRDAMDT